MTTTLESLNRTSPFMLGDDMGYVQPSTKHQFGSFEEDKKLMNQIALAIGNELAFIDCARQGKLDWLAEIQLQIQESWDWVENCISLAREMYPAKKENIS